MTLGQRIQEQRKRRNLSQEALGEAMGVSRQAISKWESDLTIPEIDKLIALSKLFDMPVGQLLGVEEQAPVEQPGRDKRTRRWLAVLTALCLILTAATALLWARTRDLTRGAAAAEPYVAVRRELFEQTECTWGDITWGFPQARGEEDLEVTLTLQPVKALKGWAVEGVRATVTGHDPWGEPKGERDWEDVLSAKVEKIFLGPYQASVTLPDYGGEQISLDVLLREKKTGRSIQVEKLFLITSTASRGNNFTVDAIQAEKRDYVAEVPLSLAAVLPDPGWVE